MRVFLGFLKIQSRNQTCFQARSQFLFVFFRTDFTSLKDSCFLLGFFWFFWQWPSFHSSHSFHCLLHGSSAELSRASLSTKVLLSVQLLLAPTPQMLNCIRLCWCRRAMTIKCDLCNSSCWMLGLWGTPASRCPLCAAVWRRSPMCSGSADCRRTLQGKKSSLREERLGRGRLLRCLMWSGSVRIPKPSPALRSSTCRFLLRFIVCYIPFFF